MAEKKPSANLLFSSDTEFSFPVPFIPVSQAQVPDSSLLSADESTDVGEEDSFVGQTSASMSHPPAFNYFSQAVTNNDPFANIGHHPRTTTAPPARTVSSSKAPAEVPVASSAHSAQDPFAFQSTHSQAGFVTPPVSQYINTTYQNNQPGLSASTAFPAASPPQTQQNYNPYRQMSQSSRASPYLPPQQLQYSQSPGQQPMPPFQSATPTNHLYQTPPISSPQAPLGQTVSTVPPPNPISTALQPLLSPPYNIYEPVRPHWFYCKMVEGKPIWMPFSFLNTLNLEEIYNSVQPDPENVVVSTDGGRYDVYLYDRLRYAVYWEEEPTEVRRCTWFYKGDLDSRFIPYSEEFSEKLEGEYKKAVTTNQWHKRLEFASGETIVMHNPKVIVQFHASSLPDEWGTTQDGQTRPRVVKRGIDDDHDEIPEGELPQINHLVFIAHGIGPVCDLRFRSIIECVDDFRNVSLKLLRTHFKKAVDENKISRVEFLPVHWHNALHGDATGVDRRIKKITLPSIGRLRHFTNETLLDIFFYNSPTYCQTIVDKMAAEINRLYALFLNRNPNFKGGVSLAGHSLGSLILFDLLANQTGCSLAGDSTQSASNGAVKDSASPEESQDQNCQDTEDFNELQDEQEEEFQSLSEVLESLSLSEYLTTLEKEKIDMESLLMCTVDDLKEMGIPLGPRKKIANFVKEKVNAQAKNKAATEKKTALEAMKKAQQEALQKTKEEAADSNSLAGEKQSMLKRVLSCGAATVSSVKVQYDRFEAGAGQVSVAYRGLDFEPDNFFALGSPIGMFLTVRGLEKIDESYRLPTCKGFFNIYHPLDPVAYRIEPMILPDLDIKPVLVPHHKGRKRLHLELKESLSRMGSDLKQGFISSLRNAWQTLNEFARAHTSTQLQVELEKVANQIKEEEDKHVEEEQKLVESPESSKDEDSTVKIGMLNGGQRIDYVLQEKPIESFNEYLFALQSHLCYWESEDTALLFLKEIYKSIGISPEQPPH